MPRPLRLALLLAAVLLLHGCSAVRFSYDHADSLLRWWIDQYVDLGPEQEALVRERLAKLHDWHRATQLGDYVVVARQAQRLISAKPTVGDVLNLVDGVSQRARTLAEQAMPDIADLLATLDTEQIERMAGRLREKNADFAKEVQLAGGDSGQRKAQLQRVLERSEYWFGDFSGEQKLALRRLIDAQPSATQFWYDERLRRQNEWLDLARLVLRERPPRDRVMRLLRDYAARFDAPGDPARLQEERALRRRSAELLLAIHGMTTPRQRAHALHKLDELIGDFAALARQKSGE